MSEQVTDHVHITFTAEDRATAEINKLRKSLERLQQSVKNIGANLNKSLSGLDMSGKTRDSFTKSTDDMTRSLRQRADAEARSTRQRIAGERAVGAEQDRQDRARAAERREGIRLDLFRFRLRERHERELGRSLRQQMSIERDAERTRAAGMREAIRLDRYRMDLRSRYEREQARERDRAVRDVRGRGREAWSRGREAGRDIIRPPAAAAVAGLAGTASALRKSLSAESSIDSAEINARIYGDLSKDAARKLRDEWAAPLAEQLGTGTDKMLSSFTDALKLGIPKAGAQQFAELATKTSEAWSVTFEGVVDILGTVNSLLTSKGDPFNFDKLKSVANSIQYLAAKQSTTPEKLMSFLQRGAGAADVLGMSQEAGLAFGSASTSLGNQAGQSGRLFDYIASRLVELPRLTKGHGDQAQQAQELIRSLGYSSAQSMDAKRRANPDEFLPDFMARFNRIKNPQQQDRSLRFFTGREWLGEFGRMVKGIETYKEAQKLSKEAKGLDAVSQVWDLHRLKLGFVFKQFRTGWLNILGEAGKVLSPLARQAGDFFLDWAAKLRQGGLANRVKAVVDGLVEGLGFKDFPALLKGIFGEPGKGMAGEINSWREAARGFGQGLRDVATTIRSFFSIFTGNDASPETIGRWTARILGFSAALIVASPVIAMLTAIGTGILAFATVIRGAFAGLRAVGLVGSAGATGGILGAGALATAGGIIGAAFLATIANKLGILKAPDTSKGWGRGILEFLDPGLASRVYGDKERDASPGWTDPPAKPGTIPNPMEEFDAIMNRLQGKPENNAGRDGPPHELDAPDKPIRKWKPPRQLGARDDLRSLIKQSSYRVFDDGDRGVNRIAESVKDLKASIQLASLTGGSGIGANLAATAGNAANAMGGGGGGGGLSGMFKPEGMRVPNWYGRGGSGGGGGGGRHGGGGGGSGTSDNSPIGAYRGKQNFQGLSPRISADLQKDFGLSKMEASAILGNLGHESAGFTAFQEGNPRSGRGGWGWAQWTGSRRRAFEAWTTARGLDPKSYEANYGFLRHELQTSHRGSLTALRNASGLEGKTMAFERSFEAAGVKHYPSRFKYARAAMGMPDGQAGVLGPIPGLSVGGASNKAGGTSASGNMKGSIDFDGEKFDFGSGGHRGANSIPFGTYPITPDTIGPWGQAHGALGINNNAIWDKSLNRMRSGIEFHQASNANMITAGCIGIARDQWQRFRKKTLDYVRKNGQAFLTVNPDGSASISSSRNPSPVKGLETGMKSPGNGQGASPPVGGFGGVRRAADEVNRIGSQAQRAYQGTVPPGSSYTGYYTFENGKRVWHPRKDGEGQSGGENGSWDVGGGIRTNGWRKPSTEEIVNRQPPGIGGRGGMGGGGGRGPVPGGPTTIHVHGAGENPQELANKVQKSVTSGWNHRAHDLEPELT